MEQMQTALVTGGSRGLGRALTSELVHRGWRVIATGRDETRLETALNEIGGAVIGIAGDIADPGHRQELRRAVDQKLDLLVNNASELGPSPLVPLAELDAQTFRRILEVNVIAPIALVAEMLPFFSENAAVVNISSDAAVEAYPHWGGYGASKAALDHAGRILAAEHPALAVYTIDPGDMRTDMHQAAFPGEDISDRPEPESVVPALLRLVHDRPPSGRYQAAQFSAGGRR